MPQVQLVNSSGMTFIHHVSVVVPVNQKCKVMFEPQLMAVDNIMFTFSDSPSSRSCFNAFDSKGSPCFAVIVIHAFCLFLAFAFASFYLIVFLF